MQQPRGAHPGEGEIPDTGRERLREIGQNTRSPPRLRDSTSLMPVSDVICQIVNGELDAAVVARDQEVIAFLDDRPAFKGHLSDPIRRTQRGTARTYLLPGFIVQWLT